MNAIDSLFTTDFREDGSSNSFTVSSYASRFIADVEGLFGPRDRSFTLVGVVIDRDPANPPQLWYPNSGIPPGDAEERSRHIVIRLASNAHADLARAKWQLAHECLHLLDPWNVKVDGRPANWLEEGLAAWYQNSRVPEAKCHEGQYALAENLVSPLMDELPQAVKRIRREQGLRISEFDPVVLQDYCPRMQEDISWMLCQPFGY